MHLWHLFWPTYLPTLNLCATPVNQLWCILCLSFVTHGNLELWPFDPEVVPQVTHAILNLCTKFKLCSISSSCVISPNATNRQRYVDVLPFITVSPQYSAFCGTIFPSSSIFKIVWPEHCDLVILSFCPPHGQSPWGPCVPNANFLRLLELQTRTSQMYRQNQYNA